MSNRPAGYLRSHEWVSLSDGLATVGITDFAVKQLTDLTYVELPAVGTAVQQGDRFGEVESVKAVSDLYSPVSGTVVETNQTLGEDVRPLSEDPFGAGWLIKVRPSDPADLGRLLSDADYKTYCESAH